MSRRAVAAGAVGLALLVVAPAGAADRTVTIRDNEFVRAGTARPRLVVAPGTVVTWRWASVQSHNVTVRSGPQRFASTTKSSGAFRRRLVRTGTYRLGCTLHAPGMRMTIVVRRRR